MSGGIICKIQVGGDPKHKAKEHQGHKGPVVHHHHHHHHHGGGGGCKEIKEKEMKKKHEHHGHSSHVVQTRKQVQTAEINMLQVKMKSCQVSSSTVHHRTAAATATATSTKRKVKTQGWIV